MSQQTYQQLYIQFKESKTLPIDYAPWESESCITDDVMRDKKITLKLLGCSSAGHSVTGVKLQAKAVRLCSGTPAHEQR